MPEIVVTAQGRTENGKNANRRLRAQGLIPGIVYGPAKEPAAVAVSPKDIVAILRSASGENTLFELDVAGRRRKVILKDYQLEPLQHHLLHADFYEVALDKPIQVTVPVELTGTPVGVKTQSGLLDFVNRSLAVECLPLDIPEKVVLDVSELALGKHLRVSDITPPKGVRVLSEPELVIAHVVAPKAEEAPAVVEAAAPTGAEPEVIKKGKGEEGEGKPEAKGDKGGDKKEKK